MQYGEHKLKLEKFFESLKAGETVLIEHDSKSVPVHSFYSLTKCTGNMRSLVDDFLDTLYIYKVHLELSGTDTSKFEDLQVIKIGGVKSVGKIVGKISSRGGVILRREYQMIYENAIDDGSLVINPVLGIEKLLILGSSRLEVLETLAEISSRLGDRRRIAVYFVDKSVLKTGEFNPLSIMEFLSTTVVNVEKRGRVYTFEVLKSINPELDGKTYSYDLDVVE